MISKGYSWLRFIAAIFAGALAPLSLSPMDLWPLGIISVMILFALVQKSSPSRAMKLGYTYGLGFFGVGVSWVYVSIHVHGQTSVLLAGALTLLFIAALALLLSVQCWTYQRFFSTRYQALSFAAVWLLFEWLRSWLLTGFPWLYLGYAQLHGPLAGYVPIIGVYGISFLVAFSACSLVQLYLRKHPHLYSIPVKLALLFCLWGVPLLLNNITWTNEQPGKQISVGLVQANISLADKFDSSHLQANSDLYQTLSQELWAHDIVFWPETAIPTTLQQAENLLTFYSNIAKNQNSSLVSGIFSRQGDTLYNSIISLGSGSTIDTSTTIINSDSNRQSIYSHSVYHKQKLVPFGEYVPLAAITGPMFQLFNLAMPGLRPYVGKQPLLRAANLNFAPFICYEVVYPDFVREHAKQADFLVTISNDSWFGDSFAPLQHLQMAAMRALENGRYMVRATSNGVSAIIDHKGRLQQTSEQFQVATLSGEVKIFSGRTPFSYWGSYPMLFISAAILAIAAGFGLTKRRH